MTTVNVSRLLAAAAQYPAYDPNAGWSSSAQPVVGLDPRSYSELAHAGAPILREKIISFCRKNGLSYIEIPHEDYRDGFERGTKRFRPWLTEYCQSNGLDPHAHLAIVGPCVKDEYSSEFKSKGRPADRVRDYLRVMGIFLEGPNRKMTLRNLDNMGDAFVALEADEANRSVGRKNNFYAPKKNGYRSYKSLQAVPLLGDYEDWEVLAELKIEHEGQQDANRMTRRFMNISRHVRDSLETFYPHCTTAQEEEYRNAQSNLRRLHNRLDALDAFSLVAYNDAHDRAGLNRFLGPNYAASYKPVSADVMQQLAIKAIEAFGPSIAREMVNAGFDYQKVRTFADKLEARM